MRPQPDMMSGSRFFRRMSGRRRHLRRCRASIFGRWRPSGRCAQHFLLIQDRTLDAERTQTLQKITQDVIGGKDRPRSLTDQLLRAAAMLIQRRAGDGIHLPVLLKRRPGRDQAAGARRRLHHEDAQRKAADDAITDRKIFGQRRRSGSEFGQEESALLHHAVKKGGIFWLDISSAYKLRHKVADNISADDREDVTYLSFNSLAKDRVEMDVTLFVRRKDGAFDRFDEHHTQYIHEEEDVSAALSGAGFSPIRVEGHLGEAKRESDRLNFICRRR